MKKIRVGVFFGGKSTEHEVSLQSARSVIDNLDKQKYEIVLIGIDKLGRFHFGPERLASPSQPLAIPQMTAGTEIVPSNIVLPTADVSANADVPLDVVFPVLHGTGGEDGTIQGLLRTLNVPFVGPDVLGSAIGMDKDVTKRLLRAAGIPCARSLTVLRHQIDELSYAQITDVLGDTLFVKPANLGSSVGISKVRSENEFMSAVEDAFAYDTKILIEEGIKGREIECAVLGNEFPKASILGEISAAHGFYSYDAKYIDPNGAKLQIPADLPRAISDKMRAMAVDAFQILCCEGMARVDFFLKDDGSALVNEINTIPGFTKISMYPKLWEASGLSYAALLDELIRLAIERHERNGKLKTSIV